MILSAKRLSAAVALCGLLVASGATAQETGMDARPDKGERIFQRFDVNGDNRVTRKEAKARLAARFDAMDRNGDGVVTRVERLAFGDARRSERQRRRFARLDANSDGSVTLEEMQAKAARRAERRFDRLDINGDGGISLVELETARRPGRDGQRRDRAEPLTLADLDARVMRMFDRADRNKDGVITPDEARLMRRNDHRS